MTVRSVERTVDVLELLGVSGRTLPLSEIARELGTPKSTTLDILRTLVARGLLALDPRTKTYRVGLGLQRFAAERAPALDLAALAKPHLESLTIETRETAYITVVEGDAIYYTAKVDSPEPVRYIAQVGTRRPLHATASGKLALAAMTDAAVRDYVRRHGLPRYTPRTVVRTADLLREVDTIRRRGYAVNLGEFLPDLFGVSAPLHDANGRMTAAVSVGGPLFRVGRRIPELARSVTAAACALSTELRLAGSGSPAEAAPRSRKRRSR